MATDPEARKDAAEARLPEVWEPEFLRTFAREAARRGVEIKLPSATLDKLADGIDVLVSELEAAQKERDELKAWYEKVAPMTVPTTREAVAEKRVRELEAWGKQIHDALDGRPLPEYPDSAPARIAALAAAVSATPTPTPTKENA